MGNPFQHPKALLVIGSIAVVALVGYLAVHRSSPGDLSRGHAAVAGGSFITDCNKCHGGKSMGGQCLYCHEEIQGQINGGKGYHHYLLRGKELECAHCHSEHNGKDFNLINQVSWGGKDPKTFSHEHTAFRLQGKHVGLACEKCHQNRVRRPFALSKFPDTPRESTFLGLTQGCIDCHKDVHAGGLAVNCEKCHGQQRWKPAPYFNHEKFFSLKGVHSKVSCAQCHIIPKSGAEIRKTKNFPFDRVLGKRCMDCHRSPHKTNWRTSCETCHAGSVPWSAATAKMIANPQTAKKFHGYTIFPLIAPHDRAACVKCHNPKLKFNDKYPDPAKPGYRRLEKYCESCHSTDPSGPRPLDPHRGQFAAKHPHCYDCHTQKGFKPGKFGMRDHSATYPLVGGHARAKCADCHVKGKNSGAVIYIGAPRSCSACHRDPHFGQFRQGAWSTNCESCHMDTSSWKRLVFNHNTQSRFKLDSAHKNVACKDCHPVVTLPSGAHTIQYKPLRMRCQDCHDFK